MLFLGCTGAICLAMLMIQISLVQVMTMTRMKEEWHWKLYFRQIVIEKGTRLSGAIWIAILWNLGVELGFGCLRSWTTREQYIQWCWWYIWTNRLVSITNGNPAYAAASYYVYARADSFEILWKFIMYSRAISKSAHEHEHESYELMFYVIPLFLNSRWLMPATNILWCFANFTNNEIKGCKFTIYFVLCVAHFGIYVL